MEEEGFMFWTAFFTVIIETPLFWLAGYRALTDCLSFACINIITNIMLNQRLRYIPFPPDSLAFWVLLVLGELCVVVLEAAMCSCAMKEVSGLRKLFITMLFTNAASFIAGLLYVFILL